MGQTEAKKNSSIWIWIILILLVISICCCVVIGGGLLYLRSQGLSWRNMISNDLVIPESNLLPVEPEATLIPLEPAQSILQPETEIPQGVMDLDPLLVVTGSGIWSVNEETQESVQLSNDPLDEPWDLQEGMSPDKSAYAYLTGFGGASLNPMLIVLDLRNEAKILQLELTGPLSQPGIDNSPGDPAFEATRAMEFTAGLAWSPDSQKLAFVAARDGDSADVYLFARSNNSVTRLSDEAGNAASLHWSQDGQFIEYLSVNSFGTGAGLSMAGLWVYDLQNQQPRLLENLESGGEDFLNWKDNRTFLIGSWSAICEAYNLRTVDVISTEQVVLFDGCFTGAAYDPQQQEGLLSVTEFNQENCNCGQSHDPGTYIFGEEIPLKKFEPIQAYSIGVIPEEQLFTLFTDQGLQYVYQNGSAITIPTEVVGLKPIPSSSGAYWAWASYHSNKTGLWITESNATPIVNVSPLFTGEPVWSRDGQTIFFIENNYLFMSSAPQFSNVDLLLEVPNAELLGVVK